MGAWCSWTEMGRQAPPYPATSRCRHSRRSRPIRRSGWLISRPTNSKRYGGGPRSAHRRVPPEAHENSGVFTGMTSLHGRRDPAVNPQICRADGWRGPHRDDRRPGSALQQNDAMCHRRTHAASRKAGLHFRRARAVVRVVTRDHHDNEIELRDDANRRPASTQRGSSADDRADRGSRTRTSGLAKKG